MKNLILANPNSGQKNGKENAQKLCSHLIDRGQDVRTIITESEDDIVTYSRESCGRYDRLIILGGDGTISDAVSTIIEEEDRPVLAILPSGTVNNFAKLIGITENPDQVIEDIINNRIEKVDIGRCNDDYFISTLTTGIIPEKIMETDDEQKANIGKLAFLSDLPELISLEDTDHFEINMDGEKLEEDLSIVLIALGNSVYGIGSIVEDASNRDGHLDFIGLRQASTPEKLSQIPQILSRNPNYSDKIIRKKFKKAVFNNMTDSKRDILLDGDPASQWPIEVEILSGAIEVVVGRNYDQIN